LRTVAAFLRRDLLVFRSYRLAALTQFAGVGALLVMAFYIGRALGRGGAVPGLGGDYISYLLVGMAFTDLLIACLRASTTAIRDGQLAGTLEPMLLTPVRLWQLLLGASAFRLLNALGRLLMVALAAVVIFGYWHHANLASAALILVPAVAVFAGTGLVAAAGVLVVKQTEPLLAGYVAVSFLFAGAVFPPGLLPGWVQPVVTVLPLTHALAGMRLAVAGASPAAVAGHAWILAAGSVVTIGAGVLALRQALLWARREGSLAQY